MRFDTAGLQCKKLICFLVRGSK